MDIKKSQKNYSGFSLLEMMISMFIFVLAIVTAVSIFSSVSFTRKNSREIQKNMEDARTALDLMAKNMRMSIGLNGTTSMIYMFNTSQGNCVSYKFESSKLKIAQKIPDASFSEAERCNTTNMTYNSSDYVDIIQNDVSGSFAIVPTSITSPKTVGKATIILTIDGVNMQTSVSFRDYNNIVQ